MASEIVHSVIKKSPSCLHNQFTLYLEVFANSCHVKPLLICQRWCMFCKLCSICKKTHKGSYFKINNDFVKSELCDIFLARGALSSTTRCRCRIDNWIQYLSKEMSACIEYTMLSHQRGTNWNLLFLCCDILGKQGYVYALLRQWVDRFPGQVDGGPYQAKNGPSKSYNNNM